MANFVRYGYLILLSFCLGGIQSETTTAEEKESADNALDVTFYMMSEQEWSKESSGFLSILLTKINKKCEKNPMTCGLEHWQDSYNFSKAEYVEQSIDADEKNYLTVTFTVKFNPNVPDDIRNETLYVLKKEVIEDALNDVREDINDALSSSSVVEINGEYYSPPIDHKLNAIMIPVSFAILLIVIIAAAACFCYRWKQEKQEKKKNKAKRKRAEKHKEEVKPTQGSPHRARVAPAPRKYPADIESSNNGYTYNKDRAMDYLPAVKPLSNLPESHYTASKQYTTNDDIKHLWINGKNSEQSPHFTTKMDASLISQTDSEPSAAYGDFHSNRNEYSNTALPPMAYYSEEKEGKRHKKKKSKKSKHHRHETDGKENNAYKGAMNIPPAIISGPHLDSESDNGYNYNGNSTQNTEL